MLKDTWQDIGRLENLFLEIIDDPSKKEILLYPICYCQLVRKESSFEINLPKLISCANKTFHTYRGRWQDILLELDLFQFITPRGEILSGKDILRFASPEGIKVCFLPEYKERFYEVYSRLLKYWTVLSKVSSYSKKNTPAEFVYLSALIFNEELYKEISHFTSTLSLRFPDEELFFSAVGNLAEFYTRIGEKKEFHVSALERALSDLEKLGGTYYGINITKLRKDVESLIKEINRGRKHFVIKISFTIGTGHGKDRLRSVISKFIGKLRKFRGGRWTLMNSGVAHSLFKGSSWRKQKGQRVPA